MSRTMSSGPNVNARYVWSPAGIDVVVLRDRDTTSDGVPDERLYVQQDAQSNVTALVNTSGAVVERSIQDPYGVRTLLTASWSSRSATLYDWKYYHQGLRLDWTQTLYDNRMRMYSPTLMRFLQNDPIGFAAGDQNTYRYEGNGPVGRLDPSGLDFRLQPVDSAGNVPWRRIGSQYWWDNGLVDQSGGNWADALVASSAYAYGSLAFDLLTVMIRNTNRNTDWSEVGVWVAEAIVSTLWEPYDWFLTGRAIAEDPTSFATYLSLLPLISASMVAAVRAGSRGVRPPNLSPRGAGRAGALHEALRRNGVPTSQQPSRVLPNIDRRGRVQPGRIYEYDVPAPGGGTRIVRIRDDAGGHNYCPGDPQNRGPHFNDEAGNHYDY